MVNHRFKVGDYVEYVKDANGCGAALGEVYKIVKIEGDRVMLGYAISDKEMEANNCMTYQLKPASQSDIVPIELMLSICQQQDHLEILKDDTSYKVDSGVIDELFDMFDEEAVSAFLTLCPVYFKKSGHTYIAKAFLNEYFDRI